MEDSDLEFLKEFLEDNSIIKNEKKCETDPEFAPMEEDDELRLEKLHEVGSMWSWPVDAAERPLYEQEYPSLGTVLQMMVGNVKRMIRMSKEFSALRALHVTDQLRLIKNCYLDVLILRSAMAYDPKENAWKGPSSSHEYTIRASHDEMNRYLLMQFLRLYVAFKEEYRSDDAVMLLLNMIVLFDPNVDGLANMGKVRAEQNKYKLCLKRYLYTKLEGDSSRAQSVYKALLDCLVDIREIKAGSHAVLVTHWDILDPLMKELVGAPNV